jgi:streptomycin 6-kinase
MLFDSDPNSRVAELARRWGVAVDRSVDTPTSVIAFGHQGAEAVVLKVVKEPGDEWRSGDVLRAFDGRGVVPLLEQVDGAVLLARLDPGTSLVEVVHRGDDAAATAILCDVIAAMSPRDPPASCPTARDWAQGFGRYAMSGDTQVPPNLVALAQRMFLTLCDSQRESRLLHGDLQHSNVLYDRDRGWVAIDPKGVIGELEYEVGAALRNPVEFPHLIGDTVTLERRIATFVSRLALDRRRAIGWGFAQAVLSAIWEVEDGHVLGATNQALILATALRPLLDEP